MPAPRRAPLAAAWALVAASLAGCLGGQAATALPSAHQTPTPVPGTSGGPAGIEPCLSAHLTARVISWGGAAGHRVASVRLTNAGTASCALAARARPQLIDGNAVVLIDGAAPPAPAPFELGAGATVTTEVQDGNYCGPNPVPPVTVAFVLSAGAGKVVATPAAPGDTSGVPPCLGSPGSSGDIEMSPWSH